MRRRKTADACIPIARKKEGRVGWYKQARG